MFAFKVLSTKLNVAQYNCVIKNCLVITTILKCIYFSLTSNFLQNYNLCLYLLTSLERRIYTKPNLWNTFSFKPFPKQNNIIIYNIVFIIIILQLIT